MIPDLRRTRECGTCTECCTGTLVADIHGYVMDKGRPCHFLGKGCTIYSDRPNVCREFQCAWLRDDGTNIPEWMKPELSKVVIIERNWGRNLDQTYWNIVESNQKIDSVILNWVYMYVSSRNICANIEVDGKFYQMGPPEFVDFMRREENSDPRRA